MYSATIVLGCCVSPQIGLPQWCCVQKPGWVSGQGKFQGSGRGVVCLGRGIRQGTVCLSCSAAVRVGHQDVGFGSYWMGVGLLVNGMWDLRFWVRFVVNTVW